MTPIRIRIIFFCIHLFVCRFLKITAFTTTTTTTTAVSIKNTQNKKSSTTASWLASNQNDDQFGELTSALIKLDREWQIQQQHQREQGHDPNKPTWKKLFLPPKDDDDDDDNLQPQQQGENYVWLLEPPKNIIPSCRVVFTGGAVLGQFPQVVYNELLSQISMKLGALCVVPAYAVNLDHFALSKRTGELIRRSLLYLDRKEQDDEEIYSHSNSSDSNMSSDDNNDTTKQKRRRLPTFLLGHSLGCKLQTIYLSATGIGNDVFDGIGFMAFNNFSFAKTITMTRSFAQELKSGATGSKSTDDGGDKVDPTNPFLGGNINNDVVKNLFDFAEMAIGAVNIDFSPSADDTERLISLRYNDKLQSITRLFIFDDDSLDSSNEFMNACKDGLIDDDNINTRDVDARFLRVSNLPGGHLCPVFFQFNADDILGDDSSRNIINDFIIPDENLKYSFGDVVSFEKLVNEITDWILDKDPSNSNASSSSDFDTNRNKETRSVI